MQRTQIHLPEELRKEVDIQRKKTGESLAEYTRKALENRVSIGKKEKVDLKALADKVIGSLKISDQEADEWIKEIREDRRLSDERLEKRWSEVYKKTKNS